MKVEKVDLTSLCEIQKAAKAINKEYDGIDILINNAGIFVWKYLTDTSDQEITKMIDVNLMAHIWVSFILYSELNYSDVLKGNLYSTICGFLIQ